MQQRHSDGRVFSGNVLTQLERNVLEAYAAGLRRAEIGHRVGLADRTVGAYLTAVKEKLGARSLAHAVAIGASMARVDGCE
jgi:DNA-binding NarL/FixJ family response regulator